MRRVATSCARLALTERRLLLSARKECAPAVRLLHSPREAPPGTRRFVPPSLEQHGERKDSHAGRDWLSDVDVDDLPQGLKLELLSALLSASSSSLSPAATVPLKQQIAQLAFSEFQKKIQGHEYGSLDEKQEAKSLLTLACANGHAEALNFAAKLLLEGNWPSIPPGAVGHGEGRPPVGNSGQRKGVIREINRLKKLNKTRQISQNPNPPKDVREGLKLLKRSAQELRNANAFVLLGNLYLENPESPAIISREDAIHFYEEAGAMDHTDALYNLGMLYYEEKDARSLECFSKAAGLGDVSAIFFLGTGYSLGCDIMKIERNEEKAVELLKQACALGHPESFTYLFKFYNERDNVEMARGYLQQALALMEEEALIICGDFHLFGNGVEFGVEKSVEKALQMYLQSQSEQGHLNAGSIYFGLRDYENCYNAYMNAANEFGSEEAWGRIADLYANGLVPKDKLPDNFTKEEFARLILNAIEHKQ